MPPRVPWIGDVSMSVDDLLKRFSSSEESARVEALRLLCTNFKTGAAPFFLSQAIVDPSPLVREMCAQLLGDNPALASLRETPLWLVGFAADSIPGVRSAALKAIGKVDPDLRFRPARGVVLLASLAGDPTAKAAARGVLEAALRRDLDSQHADRRREAFELWRRLEEPIVRLTEALVSAYSRSATIGVIFAAYGAVAFLKPPLIPNAVPRPQVTTAAAGQPQKLSRDDLERARQDIDKAKAVAGIQEIQQTGGSELPDFLQELEDLVES
jgi:hypothetical protein